MPVHAIWRCLYLKRVMEAPRDLLHRLNRDFVVSTGRSKPFLRHTPRTKMCNGTDLNLAQDERIQMVMLSQWPPRLRMLQSVVKPTFAV